MREGSAREFDANWKHRAESVYNHWTPAAPANQVQLAFRMHWEVFQEHLGRLAERPGRSLEVGCGRGSLSSYFAADGWDCTLLDISPTVIERARATFEHNGHRARFCVGDATQLEFEDESFDVVFSIGLLEHFEDVRTVLVEQVRVLRPGGTLLAYVVPESADNVQRYFNWLNGILRLGSRVFARSGEKAVAKADIFRSSYGSEHYLKELAGLPVEEIRVHGMYPLPMVSHSPEFPFSLLPSPLEQPLTLLFRGILALRKLVTGRHGWICSEKMGQAFLIVLGRSREQPGGQV